MNCRYKPMDEAILKRVLIIAVIFLVVCLQFCFGGEKVRVRVKRDIFMSINGAKGSFFVLKIR